MVLLNASSTSSAPLTDPMPRELENTSQIASEHATAVVVVTSRWLNRNAAQTMNGTIRNIRGERNGVSAPRWKVARPTASSRSEKQAASTALRRDHATRLGVTQESISGATMIIPETSPCHHVHQFDSNCVEERL